MFLRRDPFRQKHILHRFAPESPVGIHCDLDKSAKFKIKYNVSISKLWRWIILGEFSDFVKNGVKSTGKGVGNWTAGRLSSVIAELLLDSGGQKNVT